VSLRTKAVTFVAATALAAVPAAVITIGTPALVRADSCTNGDSALPLPLDAGPCADVLAQETRWLTAIVAGDVPTVESILGPTFRHINADGQLFDRAREIASIEVAVHHEPERTDC
jgi:Domain of unknown function (DUF4440)